MCLLFREMCLEPIDALLCILGSQALGDMVLVEASVFSTALESLEATYTAELLRLWPSFHSL